MASRKIAVATALNGSASIRARSTWRSPSPGVTAGYALSSGGNAGIEPTLEIIRSRLYRNPVRSGHRSKRSRIMWYAAAVGAVAAATAFTFLLRGLMGPSISLLFFPAVILTAVYGGYGPALLATVLSTASLAFFFVPPIFSFEVGTDYIIRLAVFAAGGVVTASISDARRQAEAAQRAAPEELQAAADTLRKVSGSRGCFDASLAGG